MKQLHLHSPPFETIVCGMSGEMLTLLEFEKYKISSDWTEIVTKIKQDYISIIFNEFSLRKITSCNMKH